MSFTKRVFSVEMLSSYFVDDKENGISRAIGKADCLIFRDNESAEIVRLWKEGARDQARNMMTDVLRISAAPSADN